MRRCGVVAVLACAGVAAAADPLPVSMRGAHEAGHAGVPRWHDRLWPAGEEIRYTLGAGVAEGDLQVKVLQALNDWRVNTCLQFRQCDGACEMPYINFVTSATECSGPLGMQADGPTTIAVADWCRVGEVMNTIGRALGMAYEHNRRDRDDHIIVDMSAIAPGKEAFFEKDFAGSALGGYDYDSIMHGRAFAYAKSNKPTIVAPEPIGNRDGISPGDVAAVEFMYNGCRRQYERPACMASTPEGRAVAVATGDVFRVDFTVLYNKEATIAVGYRRSTAALYRQTPTVPEGAVMSNGMGTTHVEFRTAKQDEGRELDVIVDFTTSDGYEVSCSARVAVIEKQGEAVGSVFTSNGINELFTTVRRGTINDGYDEYPPRTLDAFTVHGKDCLVTFTAIDIEVSPTAACEYDYVAIQPLEDGSGGGKFCGTTLPEPLQLTGDGFTVVMFSDNVFGGAGYALDFVCEAFDAQTPAPTPSPGQTPPPPTPAPPTPVPPTPGPLLPCQDVTTRDNNGETIAAPCGSVEDGYLREYAVGITQEVTIIGSQCLVRVVALDIEKSNDCRYDNVAVWEDGRRLLVACGSNRNDIPPPLQLTQDRFKVIFESDASQVGAGFRIEFDCEGGSLGLPPPTPVPPTPVPPTPVPPTPVPPTPVPPVACDDELSTRNNAGQTIASVCGTVTDGYPGNYPNNINQRFTITGSNCQITFTNVDVEPGNNGQCTYDFVEFAWAGRTGRACGTNAIAPFTLPSDGFQVRFFTDNSVQRTGYSFTYRCDGAP